MACKYTRAHLEVPQSLRVTTKTRSCLIYVRLHEGTRINADRPSDAQTMQKYAKKTMGIAIGNIVHVFAQ